VLLPLVLVSFAAVLSVVWVFWLPFTPAPWEERVLDRLAALLVLPYRLLPGIIFTMLVYVIKSIDLFIMRLGIGSCGSSCSTSSSLVDSLASMTVAILLNGNLFGSIYITDRRIAD